MAKTNSRLYPTYARKEVICRGCDEQLVMRRIPLCYSCRVFGGKALVIGGVLGGATVKVLSWWFGG